MSKHQVQLQPYRRVTVADGAGAPTNNERAAYLIEAPGFDGVRLACNHSGMTGTFRLDLWFLDSVTGEFFRDDGQESLIGAFGSTAFKVETGGRAFVAKVGQLSGAGAVLTITQGAYQDSKI